jgi:hypothetical protein
VDIVGFTNKGWPVWGKFSNSALRDDEISEWSWIYLIVFFEIVMANQYVMVSYIIIFNVLLSLWSLIYSMQVHARYLLLLT